SLVAAGAVLLLGVAGSALELAAVAVALGVAGTAFAVGAALVSRSGPHDRRGFDLSVFGAGIGGGAVAAGTISPLLEHVALRGVLGLVAGLPAGYALVAALLIRD